MKRIAAFFISLALLCFTAFPAFAGPKDKDEAVALVNKALAHIKEVGKDKALADIGDPKGQFVKGELYVFAYSMQGVIIAHPMNPKLVGKDMLEVKDSDGKIFTKEFITTVSSPAGHGWVDYNWTNPVSKKIEPKASYVAKAGNDMFVGCGIYK